MQDTDLNKSAFPKTLTSLYISFKRDARVDFSKLTKLRLIYFTTNRLVNAKFPPQIEDLTLRYANIRKQGGYPIHLRTLMFFFVIWSQYLEDFHSRHKLVTLFCVVLWAHIEIHWWTNIIFWKDILNFKKNSKNQQIRNWFFSWFFDILSLEKTKKNSIFLSFFKVSQSQPELDQNFQFFNDFSVFLTFQTINTFNKTSF